MPLPLHNVLPPPAARRAKTLSAWLILAALLTVTAYQLVPLANYFPRSLDYLNRPREYHLARRWQAADYFARTQAIVAQTPPDALIVLPPMSSHYGALGNAGLTDYLVFPRQTANVGDAYIARYRGPVYQVAVDAHNTQFSILRARDGLAGAAPARDWIAIPPAPENVLLALCKFLLVVLSGAWFVRKWFHLTTVVGALAASALVGITLQALVFIALAYLNLPASEPAQFALLIVLALPTLFDFVRHRPHIAWNAAPPVVVAAAISITALAVLFLFGISKPIVEWDAMAIWGIKARAIFATETLRTLDLWGAYPEYPPLVPVAMAQMGVGGEIVVKAIFPIFALCLYGVVYESLILPAWTRWLAPLPLLCAPQIVEHTQNGYANLALAVYATLAVLLLARWAKEKRDDLAIATALASCGLVLVRPDGEVYATYLFLIAWVIHWRRRAPIHRVAIFLAPFALDAVWKTFFVLYLHSTSGSLLGFATQGQQFVKYLLTTIPARTSLLPVARHLVTYSLGLGYWGLAPLVFLLLALAAPREFWHHFSVEATFVLLSIVGLALLALYLAPHWGMTYFFDATYLRLYMAIVPLIYLLVCNLLGARLAAPARHLAPATVSA
jgi:hypothetical protein